MEDQKCIIIKSIDALPKPKVQLILSGKRKCGKDFLEQILLEKFPETIVSFRISAPIKSEFAKRHGLNYGELLTASEYKETYRRDMVLWSEEVRRSDPHYFLRLTILESLKEHTDSAKPKPIWLLNDARRITDLQYFADTNQIDTSQTKVIKIRITSTERTRIERGWIFTEGIDDQTTECGLDSVTDWDFVIENDATKTELLHQLTPLFSVIQTLL